MALGTSDKQRRFDDPVAVLGERLKDGSIYRLLAEDGHEMFPDDYFADCYASPPQGRPTVLARIPFGSVLVSLFNEITVCVRFGLKELNDDRAHVAFLRFD